MCLRGLSKEIVLMLTSVRVSRCLLGWMNKQGKEACARQASERTELMDREREEGAQRKLGRLAEAISQKAFYGMLRVLDFFVGSSMPLKAFKQGSK